MIWTAIRQPAPRMIVEAMRFSTQLAIQLTLGYLEDMHIIDLPPDGTPMVYLLDKEKTGNLAD